MVRKARKPRVLWSDVENEAVKKGIRKYGKSSWVKIQRDKQFSTVLRKRTNVNIKDQYKTLEKQGQISPDEGPPSKRRKKTPFSTQEKQAIWYGARKYERKWTFILKKYAGVFKDCRTSTDLCNCFDKQLVPLYNTNPQALLAKLSLEDAATEIGVDRFSTVLAGTATPPARTVRVPDRPERQTAGRTTIAPRASGARRVLQFDNTNGDDSDDVPVLPDDEPTASLPGAPRAPSPTLEPETPGGTTRELGAPTDTPAGASAASPSTDESNPAKEFVNALEDVHEAMCVIS